MGGIIKKKKYIFSALYFLTVFLLYGKIKLDTGRIKVPDPRKNFPEEIVLTGGFSDKEKKKPIVEFEFTITSNNQVVASSSTKKDGSYKVVINLRKLKLKTIQFIIKGQLQFNFIAWGRTVATFNTSGKLPQPNHLLNGFNWQEELEMYALLLTNPTYVLTHKAASKKKKLSKKESRKRWEYHCGLWFVSWFGSGQPIEIVLVANTKKKKKRQYLNKWRGCVDFILEDCSTTGVKTKKKGTIHIFNKKWKGGKLKIKLGKKGYRELIQTIDLKKLTPYLWKNNQREKWLLYSHRK